MKRASAQHLPTDTVAQPHAARVSVLPEAAPSNHVAASATRPLDASLHRWGPESRALSPDAVIACRGDVQLAGHNLRAGAESLLTQRALVDACVPSVDWARVEDTASLTLALVSSPVPSRSINTGVRALRSQLAPVSQRLVRDARNQVDKLRLDGDVVLPLLTADDEAARLRGLLALVGVYHAAADALVGHSAVDADDLHRAESLATTLLPRLGKSSSTHRPSRSTDARDRLWTLVRRQHAWFEQIAGAVWGSGLRQHVPALLSRRVVRHAKPAPPVA